MVKEEIVKPEEKEINTKEHISLIATKLFAQSGFDGVSIRDIAQAAGVTKPVLYYYFKNKEDLYLWLIRDAYNFFIDQVKEILKGVGGFSDKLLQLSQCYIDCSTEYEDTVRLIFGAAFAPKRSLSPSIVVEHEDILIGLLAEFFREGIKDGHLRKAPVNEIIMHYHGCMNVYLMDKVLKGEPFPANIAKKIVENFNKGFGGER